uniref:SEED MATURATION PROTEIN 1 n=1 Tax=Erigeron canadensis TaxID=72917 RepID=UPI001CB99089|nr:SEED MATURATION PROTEIN 1 [Erigeron canadensis]
MAKNKGDIKYGTAQAKLSEDESLRVAYKAGTPLEAGKIADSEPVDLFSAANKISQANQQQNKGVIAESDPVDLFSAARHVADAKHKDEKDTMANRQPLPTD